MGSKRLALSPKERKLRIRFGNTNQFVIFRNSVGSRKGAGFDLAGTKPDGEVSNGNIFGFAGAVRHDGFISGFFG